VSVIAGSELAADLGNADAPVIDLSAVRQGRLEDEQLRVLATAVGDHPLPPEQLVRLEQLWEQLRESQLAPRCS
jgi:hypothetical protein